jgi:hypothetical protein
MFHSGGSTSYVCLPHVTTETKPASEKSCFTYESKTDKIKKKVGEGRLFWNIIHNLPSPIFFVNTRAGCWILFGDSEILALIYSIYKSQVVTCVCSQRTLTSEKTFIAVREYADPLSGRQMVLMSNNIDKWVNILHNFISLRNPLVDMFRCVS